MVARFGGEEFICLISAKNERDALHQTQLLKALIEQTVFTNNKIKITASYGLTSIKTYRTLNRLCIRQIISSIELKQMVEIKFHLIYPFK